MAVRKVFKLYSNCKIVKGVSRSAIYDLQRGEIQFISNKLYAYLKNYSDKDFEASLKHLESEFERNEVKEQIAYLHNKEFGFFTSEPSVFPDLAVNWDNPSEITNAIVDFGISSKHNIPLIIEQLDELGCEALQCRFFDNCDIQTITEIVNNSKGARLRSIELIIPYSNNTLLWNNLLDIIQQSGIVSMVLVYDSPYNDKDETLRQLAIKYIDYPVKKEDCGIISQESLMVSVDFFAEALHFNTCLNRKISIDEFGYIKNCPSMAVDYGKFEKNKLIEVARSIEFQQWWLLKKDDIAVCSDCELRYACSDCRAYTISGKRCTKPLKCSYNPHNMGWEVIR